MSSNIQPPSPRRRSEHRSIAATLSTLLLLAVALVGAGSAAPAGATTGSTLTLAADTQISTFNPFIAYYDGELNVIASIYPQLTVGDANNKPIGYLATSWTTSPDKLTWTFAIRSGLKWSDGQPLTASDIAWTYNLVMTNSEAATANGSLVANFKSVTAPNATTIVIKTKQPQANMLYISIPVVPEHIWKSKVASMKTFKNMDFPVVGYGPWTLVGYKTDQYATLKANKNFFMGAPKYDTLITQYFKSSDAGVAALRSGQLNQDAGITATQYKALESAKQTQTYQFAPNGWTGIEINPGARSKSGKPLGTGNPILRDQRVRTAIAWAIDRKALVTKILDGLGQPGAGYLPSGYPQWAWKPAPGQLVSYNPAKANQILDAAGYKRGPGGIRVDPKTGKKLNFRLGLHSDTTTDSQIATYLKGWLQAVGIQLTLQSMSFSSLNQNLAKGDWDMLMDAWATGSDPTYLLSIQTCGVLPNNDGSGGNTDAFYCNKKYDELYTKQLTEFNQAQRAQTIRQMQRMLYTVNVDIMLYYADALSAVRTDQTAAFVYGKPDSQGIYPLQNLFYDWRTAKPAAGDPNSSGGLGVGGYVGIGVGVVVVAGLAVFFVLRRRSTAAERE